MLLTNQLVIKIVLTSLISTLIIEILVALIIGIRRKDLIFVFLVNIMTNPFVVTVTLLMNILFGLKGKYITEGILELFALISEGIVYKLMLENKKINPFLLSVILNGSSYLLGLLLNYLIY